MPQDILQNMSFAHSEDEYTQVLRFAKENNNIAYDRFDSYTMSRVNLFALRENFDFESLEQTLDQIIKVLPAIKRIFSHPITRLKDTGEIMPVESVRVINNQTIVHASVHSELWSELTKNGIKPKKLLTVKHEDNYVIYENIGFVRMVNIILRLVRQNMRLLQDILFANRNLKFNLLERENHLAYFLAIGKLHIGYVRDYDQYRVATERCMDKLLFIERVLSARLGTPIYKRCKKLTHKFTLKKSTIFRVHKDYHQVYLLLKWFSDHDLETIDLENEKSVSVSPGYQTYCTLLSLFAAGHFNFVFDNKPLDFFNLHAEGNFANWKLHIDTIKSGEYQALRFTFKKNIVYRIVLIPCPENLKQRQKALIRFKSKYPAKEYIFVSPTQCNNSFLCLSIFDIESFRRLQQVLLRGMIYSDKEHTACPFCGKPLVMGDSESAHITSVYICNACRTKILQAICPQSNKPYYATAVTNFKKQEDDDFFVNKREHLLYQKYMEGRMFYRNITPISNDAEIICPKCKNIHS